MKFWKRYIQSKIAHHLILIIVATFIYDLPTLASGASTDYILLKQSKGAWGQRKDLFIKLNSNGYLVCLKNSNSPLRTYLQPKEDREQGVSQLDWTQSPPKLFDQIAKEILLLKVLQADKGYCRSSISDQGFVNIWMESNNEKNGIKHYLGCFSKPAGEVSFEDRLSGILNLLSYGSLTGNCVEN